MNVASHPAGVVVFVTAANRSRLSRDAKAGRAMRLAAGVYALAATLPAEAVAKHHRLAVIAHFWPGAVLSGRTALAGTAPVGGWMYVSHPNPARLTPVSLPGFRVAVEVGPGPLPGDMLMPSGLALSGRARKLVENVHPQGRPANRRAGTAAVEDAIDELARTGGTGAVTAVLAELEVVASSFDHRLVEAVRARLVAVLGTKTINVSSARLKARLGGIPFDDHRVEMLAGLIQFLQTRSPEPRPVLGSPGRWTWLPFFEAYFSNFIEGTEFGVDEARRIALEGEVPEGRPADAHDVAATYRLASDPADRCRRATSEDDLLDVLRSQHGTLMAARPDKRPGQFKELQNYAGGYQFVAPELVEGTLRRGFAAMAVLVDAFARAVAMMALITECHPFDDGNGRLARLMANAELTAAGEMRIVVPTVYRNNYLISLSGFSNRSGIGESLTSVLAFAQRWVAAIDWATFEGAKAQLEACNAFVDPGVGDATGQRLRLPPGP